jgi:hypothetical protein
MRLYADLFDVQLLPDLSIALSRDDEGENLPLTRCQAIPAPTSQGASHGFPLLVKGALDPS